MKSLQKEHKSTTMTPQSAGINVQSPQNESTPRRLTLHKCIKSSSVEKQVDKAKCVVIFEVATS